MKNLKFYLSLGALLAVVGFTVPGIAPSPAPPETAAAFSNPLQAPLSEMAERNAAIKALAHELEEETKNPEMKLLARKVYHKHQQLHLALADLASDLGFALPTLPGPAMMDEYYTVTHAEPANADRAFLEFVIEQRRLMRGNLYEIRQIDTQSPPVNDLVDYLDYEDVLRTRGLEQALYWPVGAP